MNSLPNILTVMRREATVRLRTRAFRYGTLALVIGIVAMAFVPVIVRWIEGSSTEQIAVWTEPGAIAADPAATVDAMLNAPRGAQETASPGKRFVVSTVVDLTAGRAAVGDGTYLGLLAISRAGTGDLAFTLYSDEAAGSVEPLAQQVVTTLAAQDRLMRLGVEPAAQASLFSRVPLTVLGSDPASDAAPKSTVQEGADALLGFGLSVLVLMMIVLYGNWVATSVVEEKSSRVMEVILNAARPFELLTGKVLGVGSAALVQYAAILGAGAVALLLQGPVSSLVFGGAAGDVALPPGLTLGMLAALVVYGILGFLLYSILYAAAGSLVSRQEDVNAIVLPMTLLACAGYLVATYSAIGLIDLDEVWLTVLSLVPFTSPFLVLSRATSGTLAPWEIAASIAILVGSVVIALGIASRIYAAGVLLYGQRPNARRVWRLVRRPQ